MDFFSAIVYNENAGVGSPGTKRCIPPSGAIREGIAAASDRTADKMCRTGHICRLHNHD